MAGLTCAHYLHQAGVPVRLFEKRDRVGGRVATDEVEGFRLDHGFQVFLTAYPEARAVLDYDRLDLRRFDPGALVRVGSKFHRVADPTRQPGSAFETALAPIGSFKDKMNVAHLRHQVVSGELEALFERPEMTTREALRSRWGFSDEIVERFFRPFFGGIFLDTSLSASSRTFEFVMRMFSEGDAALPAVGMQAIPAQIAEGLPPGSISLGTEVAAVSPGRVVLSDGTEIAVSAAVIATEAPAAQHLYAGAATARGAHGEHCLYFALPDAPFADPLLVLNGTSTGPINNLTFVSNVASTYAPGDQALLSVVVIESPDAPDGPLEEQVKRQLEAWYGEAAANWRHLRTYEITYGLPDQTPPYLTNRDLPVQIEPGLFRCGDYFDTASLNGAMRTGRRAAEAVREALA